SYSKKTKNRNGEFTAKLQVYLDQLSMIIPEELRNTPENSGGPGRRKTFAGSLSWSQIINSQLQVAFLADVVTQQGYLGLPFYRVYFDDGSVHKEKLPDRRFKVPLGFRANYFLGDRFIFRTYYRFYKDDWGIVSHTANLEVPVKLSPFLSVSPFYRFYNQTGAKYFAPYQEHTSQSQFYTSNFDLSKFTSNFFGAGVRITPANGVFGIQKFNMLELRYGHYTKNINMNANIISMNIKLK
ncbi:MAG TPA: DUF3570 domain-containing protein, partial [Chitinophagaceae bacterium]